MKITGEIISNNFGSGFEFTLEQDGIGEVVVIMTNERLDIVLPLLEKLSRDLGAATKRLTARRANE